MQRLCVSKSLTHSALPVVFTVQKGLGHQLADYTEPTGRVQ